MPRYRVLAEHVGGVPGHAAAPETRRHAGTPGLLRTPSGCRPSCIGSPRMETGRWPRHNPPAIQKPRNPVRPMTATSSPSIDVNQQPRPRIRPQRRGIRPGAVDHGPHPVADRAWRVQRDVVGALQLQIVPGLAEAVADQSALGDPRARGKRRRGRYRRRARRHLQNGEPQPPELHRALSGCGDRRRRHSARRVHHGRAADRQPERAALRQPGATR